MTDMKPPGSQSSDSSPSPMVCRLNAYLREVQPLPVGTQTIHVVMGNEAADLDSMVSAMLYAFLRSSHGIAGSSPVIPLINIPRADFALRTEAVYLTRSVGLDMAGVPFIDEFDLKRLHRQDRLRLTLIDHNSLAAGQAELADAVEAIIDHHADAGLYPQANPRLIEPVGSAATLVAEAILRAQPALIDAGTATLLLGTILLDTVNLDPVAKRVTPADRSVVAQLRCRAGPNPDTLFDRLQAEKFNVSGLTTRDLLRKDYKEWQSGRVRYGISTILTSMAAWFAQDPRFLEGMDDFLRSNNLHCLLAMMAYTDQQQTFRRELVILAPDRRLRERLVGWLQSEPLALVPLPLPSRSVPDRLLLFTQGNASQSRKTLQPLLHRHFAEVSTVDDAAERP